MNTAIIMVMMLNAGRIVGDLRGGKEDMTEKRFELKSWSYDKLQAVIWDNLNDEKLVLSLYEMIELLNRISQPEYDTIRVGREIMDKLAELFEVGDDGND